MSSNVIIVGPPRSGTSMTATFFKNSGYYVTENEESELQQPSEFNPHGFWEAESLRRCNTDILNAAGFQFDNTWMYDPITDLHVEKILQLSHVDKHKKLLESFSGHEPWLWKDPSLCYTLGYWWPLLEKLDVKVILVRRNPLEIHQSFLRLKWIELNGDDRDASMRRIERHMEAAERVVASFNIPHIVVDYSDYEHIPEETAKRVGEFFSVNLTGSDIGFDKKLNTSGVRGRGIRLLDRLLDLMPGGLRKFCKKLVPPFILKAIFPHR